MECLGDNKILNGWEVYLCCCWDSLGRLENLAVNELFG